MALSVSSLMAAAPHRNGIVTIRAAECWLTLAPTHPISLIRSCDSLWNIQGYTEIN
jgi:hypothetical protein